MRSLNPRIRVRTLMIVVAASGLGIGLPLRVHSLAKEYEVLALKYWMANLAYDDVDGPDTVLTPEQIRWKAHRNAMRAHNAMLRRKYEYAASRPWLAVPPDPPPPE